MPGITISEGIIIALIGFAGAVIGAAAAIMAAILKGNGNTCVMVVLSAAFGAVGGLVLGAILGVMLILIVGLPLPPAIPATVESQPPTAMPATIAPRPPTAMPTTIVPRPSIATPTVATRPCPTITKSQLEELKRCRTVEEAFSLIGKFSVDRVFYKAGDLVPSDAVVATDFSTPKIEQWGVIPIKIVEGWGLFLTTRAIETPNDGAYWCVE